jgi:hypothetical protein
MITTLRRTLLALAACLCFVTPTRADDLPEVPSLPPEGAPPTVFSFGRDNPTCGEWTNGCQICMRPAAGEMQCSTPGIACTPGPPVCRVKKEP